MANTNTTRTRPATLLAWRTRCGFSQHEAARFLEVPQSVYARLEGGRYVHPSRDVLLRVHKLTKVSLLDLLNTDSSQNRDTSRASAEAEAANL